MMKLRDLENALQEVRVFENPIAELEQYPTSAHLASQVVHMMDSTFHDINGKAVCDLGCGTGMLAIAAALSGSPFVLAVDVDPSAVTIAAENAKSTGVADELQFCLADIIDGRFLSAHPKRKPFDTVILNPPFGTKRKGVDIAFLQTAMQISSGAVYSMHKTSTRPYILKKAKQWGADAKVLAELKFDVGRMYQFHKSNTVDIEVDFWRIDASCIQDDVQFEPVRVAPPDKIPHPSTGKFPVSTRRKGGRNSRRKPPNRR